MCGEGAGILEPLQQRLSGYWSRRISAEHRIVYKVENEFAVIVTQPRYHYLTLRRGRIVRSESEGKWNPLLISRNYLFMAVEGKEGLTVFKRKMILACFILAGIGLGLPLGIALLAPEASPVGAKADLIMVFPGTPRRIAAGFELAQAGAASKLAISGLGQKDLEAQADRLGRPAGGFIVGLA